jgi:hypothetical protein
VCGLRFHQMHDGDLNLWWVPIVQAVIQVIMCTNNACWANTLCAADVEITRKLLDRRR